MPLSESASADQPIILGKWKNTSGYTDIYTFLPGGSATDLHQGTLSHGSWVQETGVMYGHPYEFWVQWDFGPPNREHFRDYIHIVDQNHYSLVNQYGDFHTAVRIIEQDISLDGACIIQVVKDPETVVVDKKAALCVNVTSTFNETVKAKIEVIYDFGRQTYVEAGKTGDGVPIVPGKNTIYLPGGPATGYTNPWMKPGEGKFLYWTTTGSDSGIRIKVDPDNAVKEDKEDNNQVQLEAKVIRTKGIKILYNFVYFPGAVDERGRLLNQDNILNPTAEYRMLMGARIESDAKYVTNMFPLSEGGVKCTVSQQAIIWPTTYIPPDYDSEWTYNWIYREVAIPLSHWATTLGYDRVVIVVAEGQIYCGAAIGMRRNPDNPVPIVLTDQFFELAESDMAIAHELGHTYNLWHPFDICWSIPELKSNYATIYDVNSREYGKTVSNLMSYEVSPWWLDSQRYEKYPSTYNDYYHVNIWNLKDQFRISPDPEIVTVSGIIHKNGTAEAPEPWYRVAGDTVDLLEGAAGSHEIVMLDKQGAILGRFGFNVSFSWMLDRNGTLTAYELDSVPFFFRVPFRDGAARIELRGEGGVTLLSRSVSSSPPKVKVEQPVAGKAYTIGENVTLSWNASDLDGDHLTHTLFYSPDAGSSWIPLGVSIHETSYTWNTTNLAEGRNYMIKVVTSDGVNVGEASSPAFSITARGSSAGAVSMPWYMVGLIVAGVAAGAIVMLLLRRRILQ